MKMKNNLGLSKKTLEIMLIFKDTSLLLLWCSLPPGVCGVVVVLMMLCEEREAGRTDIIVSCQTELQTGLIVHHLLQQRYNLIHERGILVRLVQWSRGHTFFS